MKVATKIILVMLLSIIVTGGVNAQYSVRRNQALMTLVGENVDAAGYGVAMLIQMPDGSAYRVAAGLTNIENGTRIRAEDRFRIGSLTKTFTAVLTLKLVEQGFFALDDPITRWLPEDVTSRIANSREITIRELMNHTSGIFNYVRNPRYRTISRSQPDHVWTAAETVSYAYNQRAEFEPGEGWQYSNTNYNLLQMIIEATTGTTIDKLMQRHIFSYLGLTNTRWETADTIGQGIITGYGDYNFDGILEDRTKWNDGIGLAGYAGIISNLDDLTTFMRSLYNGRLLSARSLREMTTGVATTESDHIQYGLGLYLNNDSMGLRVGHTGRTSGFSTQMWYLPERDISIVIFSNNYHTPVGMLNTLVISALEIVM